MRRFVSSLPSVSFDSFIHSFLQMLACMAVSTFLAGIASATLSVTVISPSSGSNGGASSGTPIFYDAYATSPDCPTGIAAMRVYTAPGVSAYTVNGDHLETFIALLPGRYNTVVQAWDNCGAVAKTPVSVQVPATGGISVFLPNSFVGYGPVHIAASSKTFCSRGISAMRLYSGPYVGIYTVNSDVLDAYVTLPPGNYDLTVVAWDNCGSVFTSNISSAVTGAPDGYVYGIYGSGSIGELEVGGTGNLVNSNGTAAPPKVSVPGVNSVVTDPGGWFLYASGTKGIYAYQINPANGSLVSISGSPYSANGINQIVMDPSGNYLYAVSSSIATYHINRSTGALTSTGDSVVPPFVFSATAVDNNFFYGLGAPSSGQLMGYRLNDNDGSLTPIPGLPTTVNTVSDAIVAEDHLLYVNVNGQTGGGFNGIYAYNINPSSGALTSVSGSPFAAVNSQNIGYDFVGLWGDWENRYLWAWNVDTTATNNEIYPWDISSDGSLKLTNNFAIGDPDGFAGFTEDLTGNYIFAEWTNAVEPPSIAAAGKGSRPQSQEPSEVGVQSFYISDDGKLVPNSYTVLPNTFMVHTVSRQDPN
jgi:hypothetical protein